MRRERRLRSRRDFAVVYRRGRVHRNQLLAVRVLPTEGALSRFGFTASRRLGNAVVRNRTKRRLREAARSLAVAGGWDIIVNTREPAASANYHELRQALEDLLGRARVLSQGESTPSSSD